MKLIRRTKSRLVFQLERTEADFLLRILELYPRVPPAHHLLSKAGGVPEREANQRLLDEALAEQRAENKQQLLALLADRQRFSRGEKSARLSLQAGEVEWLLQVLNDVRVGSWLLLGSPETKRQELNESTAPDYLAMELAGYFQTRLLESLGASAEAPG